MTILSPNFPISLEVRMAMGSISGLKDLKSAEEGSGKVFPFMIKQNICTYHNPFPFSHYPESLLCIQEGTSMWFPKEPQKHSPLCHWVPEPTSATIYFQASVCEKQKKTNKLDIYQCKLGFLLSANAFLISKFRIASHF